MTIRNCFTPVDAGIKPDATTNMNRRNRAAAYIKATATAKIPPTGICAASADAFSMRLTKILSMRTACCH
jgi:hypothetical protein